VTPLNCEQTQILLSAYHDDESSLEERENVELHLESCPHCQEVLRSFQALSRMAAQIQHAEGPDQWLELRTTLESDKAEITPLSAFQPRSIQNRLFSPALAILLIAAIGISYWIGFHDHQHHELSVNFDAYLTEFEKDPANADQILRDRYHGTKVSYQQAIEKLGYRPLVVDHMPSEYSLVSATLLKMPCCECLQATFRRPNGEILCVFEHDRDQPAWFGDRSTLETECDAKKCRLIQVDGQMAATWERERKFITVIGVKTVQELLLLVQAFDGNSEI